jgi:cytochrome c
MLRWLGAIGATLLLALHGFAASQPDDEAARGKALLESNCSRCHAVEAGKDSPLKQAPNLWIVLGAWPSERLEVQMSEGIGSRHPKMPQIQFSDEDIASIYYYLHGHADDVPVGRQ